MQFKDYVYLDEEKMRKYSDQMTKKPRKRKAKATKVTSNVKANALFASAQVGIEGEIVEGGGDPPSLAESFERALENGRQEYYFDAVADDVDLMTLRPMSIARLEGSVEIPLAFDLLNLMSLYLPFMVDAGIVERTADPASDLAMEILSNASADVPIVADLGGVTLSSKLKLSCIEAGDVTAIEELEGEASILLCKVISYSYGSEVAVYDPLKDFMKVGRAMRRQMERSEGLEPIIVEGPVLKTEVLAIYR